MAHALDESRGRLRKIIQGSEVSEPKLPFFHSTDAFAVGDIIDDKGEIKPQLCPVFEPEQITYLFYGRAAFRPNLNEESTELGHYLPVCIIFKPDISISIKRIFPFDSGAFTKDYYKSYLHKKMKLGDFLLEPSEETPGQVVRRFYTDNTNYIMGQAHTSEPVDPSEFEAKSYEALIDAQGSNALDSRGGVVEVQTDDILDIARDVDAIIIPSSQARSEIGRHLRDLGIEVIPYRPLGRMRPNEFTGTIYEKCVDYLCRKNLVDESRL